MEDLLSSCRICLIQSTALVPIFESKIEDTPTIEVIKRICHKIEINEHQENFPENICDSCFNILSEAQKLNELSAVSEKELISLITNDTTKDEKFDCDTIMRKEDKDPDFSLKPGKKVKRIERKFECEICHKFFEKPSKLVRHVKTHDVNKRPYACSEPDCFQRFVLPESLHRHQIIHSALTVKIAPDALKQCVICLKEFDTQEAMASHMRVHKDIMNNLEFSCSLCTKVFTKLNDLTRHSKSHSENKNYKCQICFKLFSQGSHFISHLKSHDKSFKPHFCNICNKGFQQSSTLKDHIRTHSQEKPFLCSECGKAFNNPSNLRQHVKRHLNLKEFECHLCPGKFSCKASLQSHLRSHSGVKSHSCDKCGAQFTKGSSLKKHVRSIHEGIKDHQCTTCTMKFSSHEHLKRHFRIHSGERPFKCTHASGCSKSYAQSNDLLKHMKLHLGGENVYKCTDCGESFRLKNQLRDHYAVHKNINVE